MNGSWPSGRAMSRQDILGSPVEPIPTFPPRQRRVVLCKEIHDAGIYRSRERQSHRRAARGGKVTVPAQPTGYRDGRQRQALTPPAETRSLKAVVHLRIPEYVPSAGP